MHPLTAISPITIDPADYNGITPDDISDNTIRRYRARMKWRETHIVPRTTYADPTFRTFLAQYNEPRRPDETARRLRNDLERVADEAASLTRTLRRWNAHLAADEVVRINEALDRLFAQADQLEAAMTQAVNND